MHHLSTLLRNYNCAWPHVCLLEVHFRCLVKCKMKDGERDSQVAAIINKKDNKGLFAVHPPILKN